MVKRNFNIFKSFLSNFCNLKNLYFLFFFVYNLNEMKKNAPILCTLLLVRKLFILAPRCYEINVQNLVIRFAKSDF